MSNFEAEKQQLQRLENKKQDVLEEIASKLRVEFPKVAPILEKLGGKETMVREFLLATLKDPADGAGITELEYARKYGEDALWTEIESKVSPPFS